jgi:hypothetical protein
MTNQEEFLRFVLPDDGNYWSIWVRDLDGQLKEFFYGRGTKEILVLLAMCDFFDRIGKDVYVALASQREVVPPAPGKKWPKAIRKIPNLVNLQVFFIDIDVNVDGNKPDAYATQGEAMSALLAFCTETGMPHPSLFVDSGSGGLHVYWKVDRPLPVAEWLPLAHALAAATRLKGLNCDSQCTGDASRILRVPGTHNFKRAIVGKVLMSKPGQVYQVETLRKALEPFGIREVGQGVTRNLNSELTANVSGPMPIPLNDVANAGCGVLYELLSTEGRTAPRSQPLYNHILYTSTFDPEPEDAAHGMTRQHPDYQFGDVQSKLEQKLVERRSNPALGWPSCASFNLLATQCQACVHLAKGKTPFHLVLEARQEEAKRAAEQDPNSIPHPYSRDERGHIKGMAHFNGAKDATYGVIIPYTAYDAGIYTNGEDISLVYKSTPAGKERFVQVPLASVGATAECIRHLGSQGIMINPDCHSAVRRFFVGWAEDLQNLQRIVTADMLGWNDTLGFAYGPQVYMPGVERPAFYGDADTTRLYSPRGRIDDWKTAAKMITDLKRPELEVIIASSFAAPLVKFASGDAVLLSMYSRESGIGKTTAMKIGQAVWGHPIKGLNGLDDTENALMKKVGDLGHLPLFWDEIKTKDQREKLVRLAFNLGQGKGKARLTRDIKAAEVKAFSTMFIGASNDSLANQVMRGTRGTAAGVYRVFEMVVPPPTVSSPFGITQMQSAVQDLSESYGYVGQLYAKFLGEHGLALRADVKKRQSWFEKHLKMEPQERYWMSTMATIMVGAEIANHLGVATFDLVGIQRVLEEALVQMRRRVTRDVEQMAGKVDIDELLSLLIAETRTHNLLHTHYVLAGGGRPVENKILNVEMGARLTHIWCQLGEKDNVLRVKVNEFKNWLEEHEYNIAQVIDLLERHYGMQGPHLKTLGGGTALIGSLLTRAQSRCYDIQLPASLTSASGS